MTQRLLPYSPERDIYQLLQVDPRAETDEILDAWRRLARTFHPDRNGSYRANEEMQVVNAVRDLMTNPTARAEYDRERQRWITAGSATNGHDLGPRERTLYSSTRPLRRARAPELGRVSTGLGRTARALGAGLRTFAVELLPRRCERCGGAVGRTDARCWICGFPTTAPRNP
jgi:curved DNA-binding protein CbpA